MKPIRLQVKMPSIGVISVRGHVRSGDVEAPVETMVDALQRLEFNGALTSDAVRVRAFVPPIYRAHLRQRGRLIGVDRVWCFAYVEDNKKSLAPFMASGDLEWNAEEAQP